MNFDIKYMCISCFNPSPLQNFLFGSCGFPVALQLGSFEGWPRGLNYNSALMDLTFISVRTQNSGEFRLLWWRAIDQPGGGLLLLLFSLPWLWGWGEEFSIPWRHHCHYFNLKKKQNFIPRPPPSSCVVVTCIKNVSIFATRGHSCSEV